MGRGGFFDDNNRTSVFGVSSTDGVTPVALWADPTTHALVVNASVTISGVATAANQTNGTQKTQIVDGSGNVIAATANALNVNLQNASVAVTGTFWQATQPISAAALPLPSGAATSAKQPALGVAGTASSDVITVQGISGMTALKVDGSAVTQPVSGTITANAGTGTFTVAGAKTNNNAAPGATNIGALVALANAGAPTWTEGNEVLLSTDLSGALRVTGSLSVGGTADNATFTAGTSTGTPAMGFFHSVIDAVTDGNAAALAIDAKRNLFTVLRDAAGNARGANVNASNQLSVSVDNNPVLGAGSAVIGHVIVDSGAVTATLSAETTKVIGTVNIASSQTIAVTNAGTFATQATLAAETTKVIGTVRNADGAGNLWTSNSTTYTAKFAQDGNLLGTLGTAFTTAGKVDVKGADGDVFVRQATGTNLHMVVDSGTITSITNSVTVTATNLSTNLAQVNGVTTLAGNGASGTGAQRVTIASDSTGQVAPAANATATGTSIYNNTALSNTKQAVNASAGNLYGYHIYNPNTVVIYIQLWNIASASVTVGTTAPTAVLAVPAGGWADAPPNGPPITFATALTIAATTTATGLTAPTTALLCNIWYK